METWVQTYQKGTRLLKLNKDLWELIGLFLGCDTPIARAYWTLSMVIELRKEEITEFMEMVEKKGCRRFPWEKDYNNIKRRRRRY